MAATAAALAEVASAQSIVLVEGVSDQIALETLAQRLSRDLSEDGVVIVPIGGAQAVERFLERFGPNGTDHPVFGLCDAGEEQYFRRALDVAGLGSPKTRTDMEDLGFFVCVEDLEDELIRAAGRELIEQLLDDNGDLSSFRTLQKQFAWRDRDFDAQMRRFLGAGARRKSRYAHLLVDALPLERMPAPLSDVLART
ncbi:MAG: ATP-dependent endonuclease [Acidimicrobiales bacterium]|nr:ATP-dependent endonuclease [Acidimicrobiia bacterium]NNC80628.1 ATP-dependent endonuclease [Acidimicrobiales bacterium]RZV47732.1 MAG: ATP-dependent endonuclease [Acidimicrobiales bacterium]